MITAVEIERSVVIVGGGLGGVAAAMALAEAGVDCLIIEPTLWLGGQLTSQAVPADENRWVETFGASRSYARLREGIRAWYRSYGHLTPDRVHQKHLNPGGGWVSRLCCSPAIAHAVLRQELASYEASGVLTVQCGATPSEVEIEGDAVRSVRYTDAQGRHCVATGRLFLEASETGELLELAGIERRIGAEASTTNDELHGLPEADARCQQPPSWCFALEHRPGEVWTIAKPDGYDELASWIPAMRDRPWPGPLFSWTIPTHGQQAARVLPLVPWPDEPADGSWELWRYRRIVEAAAHTDGRPDVCLVNWVQMDDWREPTLTRSRDDRDAVFTRSRQISACLLHWMQTEAPRHDGGVGYPGLRLCGDELGTEDGFAIAPYIREPMRLEALRMLAEPDIGSDQRRHMEAGIGDVPVEGRCQPFHDSVAIGHYHIDLHPTPTGRNSVYVESTPFQIPFRSLVPVRCTNVIAAGKCLGVTHIVNGATRTHAVEWAIGEAAGTAAALCVHMGLGPQSIAESDTLVGTLRDELNKRGAQTAWPWDPPAGSF